MTILRNILAVVIGLVLGSIANMTLVHAGHTLLPPPAGVDMTDMEKLKTSAHLLEPKHFLFPFLAHAAGTLAGAATAHLIAGSRRATFAYVIGALFLLGGIAATFMIPAPAWFVAVDLLFAYLPMAWLGVRLGEKLRPAGASAPVERHRPA